MSGSGFSWELNYLFLVSMGQGYHKAQGGWEGRGFLLCGPISRGIVGRPMPTIQGKREFSRRLLLISSVTTFLVYTSGVFVSHTSILQGQGASSAGIALKSGSWAVRGDGAWATWILVCGAILDGERAPAVLILVSPTPRVVVQRG